MPRRQELFDDDFLALLERLRLAGKQLSSRPSAGSRRGRRIGDGMEFADFRDYSAGDDLRFVDWPYYARMERLLVRLFHQHSEGGVTVLLDTSASMAPAGDRPKLDYALKTTAALAFVAMANFERVTVQPFADKLAPPMAAGRNRQAILPLLDFLAGVTAGGRTDLASAVGKLLAGPPRPSMVILISDLLDSGQALADAAGLLSAQGVELVVVHVYSPADAAPSPPALLELEHAETLQRLNIHADQRLLDEYRRQWQVFATGCERACTVRGGTYVGAPTDMPFDQLVLRTLRKAGVLQ